MVLPWRDTHRILFTDNLYTTPALCRHLLTIGLRSCGTFRANRSHLPPGLKDAIKEVGEGETKAWQSGQLGCLVWCDKQPVQMLSTHQQVDIMTSVPTNRGPSQPPVVTKPQVVLDSMNEIYLLAAHRCQCVMVSCYFVLFHPLLALMTALE